MEKLTNGLRGAPEGAPLKRCNQCKLEKELSFFSKRASSKDGLQHHCKGCNADWQRSHPRQRRESWLKFRHANYLRVKYGITEDQYWEMHREQFGRCAICLEVGQEHLRNAKWTRPLHVDHDHVTGRVRGLLCHHCNVAIGSLQECGERLRNAIIYLGLE